MGIVAWDNHPPPAQNTQRAYPGLWELSTQNQQYEHTNKQMAIDLEDYIGSGVDTKNESFL